MTNKMKFIFVATLFFGIFSSVMTWAENEELKFIDLIIDQNSQRLQEMFDNKEVQFKDAAAQTTYLQTILELNKARKFITKLKQSLDGTAKIDRVIEKARLIQNVLASYLGTKEMFGYHLKKGPITFEAGASGFFEEIIKKLPFLGGVRAGGRITVNPGEEIITQFNSLKTEFYGLLVEAAHIDKTDSRLKNMAKWGSDTKVIYPGEAFGEKIITTEQMWSLDIR